MAVQDRTNLKSYFTTGEVITQPHMDDLIDSALNPSTMTMGFIISNGSNVIETGSKGFSRVTKSGTITDWTLIANGSSNVTVTILACTAANFPTTSSIVAAAKPTLTNQSNATSSTLTGWTRTLTEGQFLEWNVDTCDASKLILEVTISVP
jgi:hypothetical protein